METDWVYEMKKKSKTKKQQNKKQKRKTHKHKKNNSNNKKRKKKHGCTLCLYESEMQFNAFNESEMQFPNQIEGISRYI